MSFARGDLARRAALADSLAVPEPWGANDDPRVFAAIRDLRDEFRRLGITDEDGKGRLPDFLLDYENLPPIKPVALNRAHARNSSATRWDQDGNLVEEPSDTLRLQRDPATQAVEGLLYEPQRTNKYGSATDFTDSFWTKGNCSVKSGATDLGQSYQIINENSDTDEIHFVGDAFSVDTPTGTPFSQSFIVKPINRNYVALRVFTEDGNGNTDGPVEIWFNISNGKVGTTNNSSSASVIEASIETLENGWHRTKLSINPPSNIRLRKSNIALADADGSVSYDGQGQDAIQILHAQIEESREVTTPILDGSATRGADAVDYRFDFPDKTTGVAFSVKQEAGTGGGRAFHARPGITMGTTSTNDKHHGVYMWGRGIYQDQGDGWQNFARNTDEQNNDGVSPREETIDRLEVEMGGRVNDAVLILRQTAIHTRPHTQAQKDTLRDQYLTQP